jgi:DnaJ-class molecular chaperone
MGGRERREKKKVDNEGLYKLLGVDKKATKSEIKKAFFKLARKKHPDKGGDAKEFTEINAAYDVLKNEDMRAAYDKYGMEGLKEGRGKHGQGPSGFEDIFSFFGNQGGGRGRRDQGQRKAKGMLKEMKITLEESYNGGMKKFPHERYRVCE